ncbi:MAG: aliphatic sulfonate ABC transporter substrate-binding protein [Armatimonadia bacterium]
MNSVVLRQKHTAVALIALFALVAALAGCRPPQSATPGEPQAGSAAPSKSAVTLNVGYFPNVTHAPAVLGFSAGEQTFAKALSGQAEVQTKIFNAGPTAMEALHAKAIDLSFVGPTPAINAHARGGDVVLVANVANGGSVLVARKDSGIKTLKDLEGKRVAVPQLGNTQDALLRHLLRQAKVKLSDQGGKTQVLPVENPDIMGLFMRKQLDAACVPEPWGSRLEVEAGATVVLDWKALWRNGNYPVTVLVARREFLQQHAEVVGAFVAALKGITDRVAAQPEAEAKALNAELGKLTGKSLQPQVINKALKRIQFTTTISPDGLQAMAEVMKEIGYAKTVPDLSQFIDGRFLPGAKPEQPRP